MRTFWQAASCQTISGKFRAGLAKPESVPVHPHSHHNILIVILAQQREGHYSNCFKCDRHGGFGMKNLVSCPMPILLSPCPSLEEHLCAGLGEQVWAGVRELHLQNQPVTCFFN